LPRLYSDGAEVAVVDAELLRLPLEHDQEGVDDEGLPRPEAVRTSDSAGSKAAILDPSS